MGGVLILIMDARFLVHMSSTSYLTFTLQSGGSCTQVVLPLEHLFWTLTIVMPLHLALRVAPHLKVLSMWQPSVHRGTWFLQQISHL